MLKDIERKKKIQVMRLKLLDDMQKALKGYKELGGEDFLVFAKELGRDSQKLKEILARMK